MTDYAGALIICKHKLLMLLRDDKPDLFSPNCWGIIGGNIEAGEEVLTALKREIKEEVNLILDNFTFLGKLEKPNGGTRHVFAIWVTDEDIKDMHLGNEGQELKFFTFEELPELKLAGNFLNYYEKYGTELRGLLDK